MYYIFFLTMYAQLVLKRMPSYAVSHHSSIRCRQWPRNPLRPRWWSSVLPELSLLCRDFHVPWRPLSMMCYRHLPLRPKPKPVCRNQRDGDAVSRGSHFLVVVSSSFNRASVFHGLPLDDEKDLDLYLKFSPSALSNLIYDSLLHQ